MGHWLRRLGQIVETLRSVWRFEPIELDPVKRRLRRAASIADLRLLAKRRLPRGVFDYIDGGAEDERTLAENVRGFSRITFRPRVLCVDVAAIDTSTTILGSQTPVPLALSPTGFNRMADPEGELAVARAALRAGLPYSLSTLGTRSIEDVAAVNSGRKWFQLYVWKDRGLVKEMIERARDAGFEALILTVDTPVQGSRERDVRHGFVIPPKLGIDTLLDGMLHAGWTLDFLLAEPIRFANVTDRGVPDGTRPVELVDVINNLLDPWIGWDDVDWLRSVWGGPLIVKGIQTVEDAMIAADHGVEAVALSNHGGRQLDSAPSPIALVGPVVDAVGGRAEVYCDGGVRRGSDIVKAVALGATACTIGRAYLYGLGAAGERGVDHALEMLTYDVRRTMALLGVTTIADITRDHVELSPR